jgi:hypothetical protein
MLEMFDSKKKKTRKSWRKCWNCSTEKKLEKAGVNVGNVRQQKIGSTKSSTHIWFDKIRVRHILYFDKCKYRKMQGSTYTQFDRF